MIPIKCQTVYKILWMILVSLDCFFLCMIAIYCISYMDSSDLYRMLDCLYLSVDSSDLNRRPDSVLIMQIWAAAVKMLLAYS